MLTQPCLFRRPLLFRSYTPQRPLGDVGSGREGRPGSRLAAGPRSTAQEASADARHGRRLPRQARCAGAELKGAEVAADTDAVPGAGGAGPAAAAAASLSADAALHLAPSSDDSDGEETSRPAASARNVAQPRRGAERLEAPTARYGAVHRGGAAGSGTLQLLSAAAEVAAAQELGGEAQNADSEDRTAAAVTGWFSATLRAATGQRAADAAAGAGSWWGKVLSMFGVPGDRQP